jgi:hypothetical protein
VQKSPQGLRAFGSERRAGDARRNAPEAPKRVSSVQVNPKGAADLYEICWSRSGQTLGRRPEALPLTGGRGGCKRARGIAATPVVATERDEGLRRENAPGPRAGRRPTSRPGCMGLERYGVVVSLSSCSSELGEWKPCGKATRSRVETRDGSVSEDGLGRAHEPHGRQRPSWPRSDAGSKPPRR